MKPLLQITTLLLLRVGERVGEKPQQQHDHDAGAKKERSKRAGRRLARTASRNTVGGIDHEGVVIKRKWRAHPAAGPPKPTYTLSAGRTAMGAFSRPFQDLLGRFWRSGLRGGTDFMQNGGCRFRA